MKKSNTYTRLHIHFVFAVKFRAAVIDQQWEDHLHKYITGIVQNNGHKMLCINTVPDHLHFIAGINPTQSISKMMELVKGDSSEFVNKEQFTARKFYWQSGFGAFSVSYSHVDRVIKYILNQKQHHQVSTFKQEYVKMLVDNQVDYNEQYIFQDLADD
ncbi:IS200/IS605 family transposase [Segetibacter sp. 3557_3]|uniref:IS200/IS605 family transposase n=1 Tax=Segetibacter sp. 3557_3 TaxID=2547429 RepID=UPI001058AAF4|nr:IS200/IS605 family transposase [Segetibacter sp. 3557_3]TDH27458.1 IS200/IS605 family transposase [Segetibacter sp. 3557_3]